MHDGVDALEGAPARLGIADVAALQVHAERVEPLRHVFLAVQQHVQAPHLMPGLEQFVHQLAADIAGGTRHKYLHCAVPVCGSRSGRNIGRSCSNSISAFS